MEFIVSMDELATRGSIGAIKEALTVEFPKVYAILFAMEFVSHITIRIPCLRPPRAIVSNFQAQLKGMQFEEAHIIPTKEYPVVNG